MSLTKSKAFQFPSSRNIISTTGSVAGTAVLLRSLAKKYLPRELRYVLFSNIQKPFSYLSSQFTLFIHEFEGLSYNQLFKAAELYLRPHLSPDTKRFRVSMPNKENKISVVMDRNQEIVENFNGVRVQWTLVCKRIPPKYIQAPVSDRYDRTFKSELCYFRLCFNRKHKDMVFAEYLPYVMEKAKQVKQEQKTLKLFTLASDRIRGRRGETWQSVTFDHPATFDTLALDLEVKQMIMEDLDRFVQRKDLYRKVGKAWKRGYLLYGPPGTGKSSLVAAMANYLNFDIYDLELADLRRNSELRKLLISTGNRSILVVEDIDCSIELQDRHAKAARPKPRASTSHSHPFESQLPKVSLSGFLNFIDGLWSSCGDERIIVFTTNHKEKLDPALLRPGRMDVHIHMPYCSPCAFKMLASNYLGITEHPLFAQVEDLLKTTKVTPAEVGEPLLQNEDSEIALRSLIQFLTVNKGANEVESSPPKAQTEIEKEGTNLSCCNHDFEGENVLA